MRIDDRFRSLKDTAPPDLWEDIVHREPRAAPGPSRTARYTAAALALAVAAGGLAVAVRAFSDRKAPPRPATTADPRTTVTIETDRMSDVVTGFGSVWAVEWWSGGGRDSLFRIDPETAQVVSRIPVSTSPVWAFGGGGLAVGDGSVWIANAVRFEGAGWQAALVRVDPQLDAEVEVIPLGGDVAGDVEIGEGAIWVSIEAKRSTELLRLDLLSHEVVARIPLAGSYPPHLVVADGAVWVTEGGPVLTRVDARTNSVTGRVDVGGSARVAVFDGEVWAITDEGFLRVDPANAMAGPEPVPARGDPVAGEIGKLNARGEATTNVAPGAGGLWFVQKRSGDLTVTRFNPETEAIDASVELPADAYPIALNVTDDWIWVLDRYQVLTRIPVPPNTG